MVVGVGGASVVGALAAGLALLPGAGQALPSGTEAPGLPQVVLQVSDVRYGGHSGDPLPADKSAVRLRSAESEFLEVGLKSQWSVSTRYALENPGGQGTELTLILPEEGCPKGRACTPLGGMIQDLGVLLDKQVLPAQPATSAALAALPGAPARGYQLKVPFAGKQKRSLDVEYGVDLSQGSKWEALHHRGAGAAGLAPDKVSYTVMLRRAVPYVLYPKPFKLTGFTDRQSDGGPGSLARLTFTASGAAAREDFALFFPSDAVVGHTLYGDCEGFRGDRPAEELTKLLGRYVKEHLAACRDLVYALHGARGAQPAPKLPGFALGANLVTAPRPQNKGFQESLLSRGEQAYIRAIDEALKRAK